jgi:hypothetical protein
MTNNCKKKKLEQELIKINNQIKPKLSIENTIMQKIDELDKNIKAIKQDIPIPDNTINNKLLDIIIDKNKTIDKLSNKETVIPEIQNDTLREENNYIDVLELCKICDVTINKFYEWMSLESTKLLITEFANEVKVINNKDNQNWIHPDFSIQFAFWISPIIALKISKLVRTKIINNNYEQIKLLEDLYLKKRKRKEYPKQNVIYIVTTIENKKNRIYIVGKAKELKNRLSTYDKSTDHEVIYWKECKSESESDMRIIETLVLNKLDKYREKANRDRFILPIDKDISLFSSIINDTIDFFYKDIDL